MSAVQYFRGRLFENSCLHKLWIAMAPSGFIALLAGWFVTEIGRQPYSVYGVLRTAEAVSPAIIGPQVAWSLAAFVIIYTFIFGAGSYYIFKLIRTGIPVIDDHEQFYSHGIEASVIKANVGGSDV
jgi:cytochrome d ubiquinol oxidase subunit I